MARLLRLLAATIVGVGTVYTCTGWNREAAPVLLILGLLLAVLSLLLDRRGRP